jgi:hypothetical protein
MYLNFKNLILVISALFMSHTIAAPIETQIDGEDVKVYTGFKKIGEIGNIDSSINNNEVNKDVKSVSDAKVNIEVKEQTLKGESLQSTNDFSDSIENDNSNIVVVGNNVYQEDLKPSLHHIALVKSKNSSYLLGKTIIVECNDDSSNCLNTDLAIEQVLKLDDYMYLLKVKDFNEWQNVMGYLKSNSGIKTISPFYDKQISAKVY